MVTDRDRSVVAWVAVIGAVSAQDVMARFGVGRTVAYRRLAVLVELGVLRRVRLLYGQPALYTRDQGGTGVGRTAAVDPARVGVATVRHWATCARLAVILERAERVRVWGEPRLRAAERDAGAPLASAELGLTGDGRRRLRRPDLVLFPLGARSGLPVAVEVELSVKGSRRLEAICRAWARCRLVSEVRYYAPPGVARAVSRAVSSVHAEGAIRVLSLEDALSDGEVTAWPARRLTRWSMP